MSVAIAVHIRPGQPGKVSYFLPVPLRDLPNWNRRISLVGHK